MDYEFNVWLLGGGLILGLMFGGIVQRSGFCMSAVVSNMVLMRDFRQFHAFLAAIAVAVIGTQLLAVSGLVDLAESTYLVSRMNWPGLRFLLPVAKITARQVSAKKVIKTFSESPSKPGTVAISTGISNTVA